MTYPEIYQRAEQAYNEGDYADAERLALEGYEKETDVNARISFQELLGRILWRQGKFEDAYYHTSCAKDHYQSSANTKRYAKTLSTLGGICASRGDFTLAIEYQNESLAIYQSVGDEIEAARVKCNVGVAYKNLSQFGLALDYMHDALQTHERLGNRAGAAIAKGNLGSVYDIVADYPKALEYFHQALTDHVELGAKGAAANVRGNLGNVYDSLADYPRALEYMQQSLDEHEQLGMVAGVATLKGNIGGIYSSLHNYAMAAKYYHEALAKQEALGMKSQAADMRGNIAQLLQAEGNFAAAFEYFHQALHEHQSIGNMARVALVKRNIGNLYAEDRAELFDPAMAEKLLLESIAELQKYNTTLELYQAHLWLSELYKKQERYSEALQHFEAFHSLKESVQNEEYQRRAERLDHERKTADREKQIAVERAHHESTQKLLHNTLPRSVAERLLAGERVADTYGNVTVLFADIVDFTRLSSRISAQELVEGLDRIFTACDALAEKYGLEKIKTIGDAYMAIVGAPIVREDHARVAAEMALAMMDEVKSLALISEGETLNLRIGLHCGTAVAGVIGRKKFAYDLWGDTVNIASRMESHGEAGKIHVSEDFVRQLSMGSGQLSMGNGQLSKDNGQSIIDNSAFTINNSPFTLNHSSLTIDNCQLTIIPRGEMEIKGKGKMKTYFMQRAYQEQ